MPSSPVQTVALIVDVKDKGSVILTCCWARPRSAPAG
jgi:hypothetical protein